MLPSETVLLKSYCREHLGLRRVRLGVMDSKLLQHRYLWPELLELEQPRARFHHAGFGWGRVNLLHSS